MRKLRLQPGGEILEIPVSMLRSNPLRARIYYNDEKTAWLTESIRRFGVIEPLTVFAPRPGIYVIVAGERRFRAAKALGYRYLPCVLCESDAENALYMVLSNELTAERLTYFETAVCFEKLHDHFSVPYDQVAERLGIPLGEVMERLRLLKIPPKLRRRMVENGLGEAYARLLLHLDETDMEALLDEIVTNRLTLSEAKARAAALVKKDGAKLRVLTFWQDSRIFRNTIENTVQRMQKAGIKTDFDRTEGEADVEYRIRVAK